MVARKHDDEAMKMALEGRTVVEAAKLLGMHERTLRGHKARMARQGWSPEHDMTKTVPDGFHLKGTSTLYDKDGNG
jgi:transposase